MKISRRQFLKHVCCIGAVASYPLLIEHCLVQTNSYRIPVANLPHSFNGFRIVQLTDLHFGAMFQTQWIYYITEITNNMKGDIIVCTGDYVQGTSSTREIDTVWQLLSNLNASSGVFSVLGNHDHWADTARSDYWLKKTGQDLRHKAVPIRRGPDTLWIAGAGDLFEDHQDLDKVLEQIPEADCRIVLAHNPDTADTPYRKRIDLIISGHTHGGQVKIPFFGAPYLPVQNKEYTEGLKRSHCWCPVFISRGIGSAILPVRFNCFPEIAVLELVPAQDAPATQSIVLKRTNMEAG